MKLFIHIYFRSSIFSLPFSVESGESVSTTFQAVKLLRRLYNVDVEKRQNLVLMVIGRTKKKIPNACIRYLYLWHLCGWVYGYMKISSENFDNFEYICSNHRLWVHPEYMFWLKNLKIRYIPIYPNIILYKSEV